MENSLWNEHCEKIKAERARVAQKAAVVPVLTKQKSEIETRIKELEQIVDDENQTVKTVRQAQAELEQAKNKLKEVNSQLSTWDRR